MSPKGCCNQAPLPGAYQGSGVTLKPQSLLDLSGAGLTSAQDPTGSCPRPAAPSTPSHSSAFNFVPETFTAWKSRIQIPSPPIALRPWRIFSPSPGLVYLHHSGIWLVNDKPLASLLFGPVTQGGQSQQLQGNSSRDRSRNKQRSTDEKPNRRTRWLVWDNGEWWRLGVIGINNGNKFKKRM